MKPSADEIQKFIKITEPEFECSGKPIELSGGNLNYVWRIPGRPHNIIAKHAPPFIASNPEEALNQDRLRFEADALRLFTENGRLSFLSSKDISVPKFYGFDSKKNLLLMEGIGSESTLFSEPMFRNYNDSMPAILGNFIANLHRETAGDSFFKRSFQNLNIQKTRRQVQYKGAGQFLKNAGITPSSVAINNAERLGEELLMPGKCLVMGDLWPSSILINEQKMRLIDWEFCHYGRPLQDVAHFIAHCRLHQEASDDLFRREQLQKFCGHFLKSYRLSLGNDFSNLFDEKESRELAIHYAMEILIRISGPFKHGYLFDSHSSDHSKIQKLATEASELLKNPEDSEDYFWD
ncbi:MAG TPA: aminoglycoside phosphotransferase family protein [Balneolaceae bacterium]|nr:aminoglycoside phosphotransferase family protein [Balneolaceae bacterium]